MTVKKILVYVCAVMLWANACIDFGGWVRTETTKRGAAADARSALPGVAVNKVECARVKSLGWVCELDLTLSTGQNGQVVKVYSDEEIKEALSK